MVIKKHKFERRSLVQQCNSAQLYLQQCSLNNLIEPTVESEPGFQLDEERCASAEGRPSPTNHYCIDSVHLNSRWWDQFCFSWLQFVLPLSGPHCLLIDSHKTLTIQLLGLSNAIESELTNKMMPLMLRYVHLSS